ncbi:MAG: trigger factor [Coriobacteriia bacterium]
MNSVTTTIERLEGDAVAVDITVSAVDVDAAITAAYSEAASKYRFQGFRPGKAPRPVIDAQFGRDRLLADALETLVSDAYPLALDANDLRPIDRPDFGDLEGMEAGKDYSFRMTVHLKPEHALSGLDDMTVTVPPSKASDREVEAQIAYNRERYATLAPVSGRGVAAGDFALISFVGTVDGEPYEGNTLDKYLYELGRGIMPKEFDDGLIGVEAGAEAHIEFPIPDSSAIAEFVGRTAVFDVTVHEVKEKVLPPLDDEYAGNVGGFETIDEYRADVRTKLDESKSAGYLQMVEREARALLAQRLQGDAPDAMVTSRTDRLFQDFFENLKERGMSIEEYVRATGVPAEQVKADVEREARMQIREELALEALFRAQGMTITDEELDAEIEQIAASSKGAPERLKERLRESGTLPLVREEIMHRMAVRWLMEHITIVEQEPSTGAEEAPAAKTKKKAPAKKKSAGAKEE